MRVVVTIRRRAQIADPEGATIQRALGELGYSDVETVRVNRTIEISLPIEDRDGAVSEVRSMCERLLVNPVMEDFDIETIE